VAPHPITFSPIKLNLDEGEFAAAQLRSMMVIWGFELWRKCFPNVFGPRIDPGYSVPRLSAGLARLLPSMRRRTLGASCLRASHNTEYLLYRLFWPIHLRVASQISFILPHSESDQLIILILVQISLLLLWSSRRRCSGAAVKFPWRNGYCLS